jgi:hypothetical protein
MRPSAIRVLGAAALLAFALGGLGAACDPGFEILRPREGEVVAGSAVQIQVAIDPEAYDMTSLAASLNGHPVPLSGGPQLWNATLPVGNPPAGPSLLVVKARAKNGTQVSDERRFEVR